MVEELGFHGMPFGNRIRVDRHMVETINSSDSWSNWSGCRQGCENASIYGSEVNNMVPKPFH